MQALRDRGWTNTLISKHLGKADMWATVDHFRKFGGKRTYFLARVEQAEVEDEFKDEFSKSIRRRGIKKSEAKEFLNNRAATQGQVEAWNRSLTKDDIRTMQIFEQVTETFQDMRRKGLRTPHKA